MRQLKPLCGSLKIKLALAGAVAMSFLPALSASANSPATFAQFHELTTGNGNLFSYTSNTIPQNGPTGVFFTAVSIPVSFSYVGLPGLSADLQGNQAATLTLTSETTQPAIALGGGFSDEQFPFNGDRADTLTITRDTPAGEGTGTQDNLLTMRFSAQLLGAAGGNTATLTGQSALGYVIDYSSDFLSFNNAGVQNFALSLSSWLSDDGGGVEVNPTTNFFQDATAAGAGTFDTTFVPEPGTLALALLGFPMILARRRRVS